MAGKEVRITLTSWLIEGAEAFRDQFGYQYTNDAIRELLRIGIITATKNRGLVVQGHNPVPPQDAEAA